MLTIWDGGGNDTLDLSGFNSNSIIDLNGGAFSSASNKVTDAVKAQDMAALGITTEAKWQSFLAKYALNSDGSLHDNISIAYGAQIENAIGGVGNDTIKGNDVGNLLVGNAGNDIISGGDGFDVIKLGAGNDIFVAEKRHEDQLQGRQPCLGSYHRLHDRIGQHRPERSWLVQFQRLGGKQERRRPHLQGVRQHQRRRERARYRHPQPRWRV